MKMMKTYSYIAAGTEFTTLEKGVPAPYFRKTFTVEQKIVRAMLTVTGLGFYEVYCNGKNITKGLLAPYRSNPEDIVYFDEYDVTDCITIGKNVIAAVLGNGMQNAPGAYIWKFETASFRSSPKLCFTLSLTMEDGTVTEVISDTDTKTAPSPIIFDDLHYGEHYDARLEIPGWNEPEFNDDGWENAIPAVVPQGECRICEAEPITLREELLPVSVTEYDGGYIYDFGYNQAGLCRLRLKNGIMGQRVMMQFCEQLIDGKPTLHNIRFDRQGKVTLFQEDIYYSAGRAEETYLPRFTYHGFRYVYVTGITASQATPDLLTYLVFNSAIPVNGRFCCDDETVNQLQQATLRSDYANFYYFPTDCPQREKNGWTADAALSAEQVILNFNPQNSYREWLRNIYKAMDERGAIPGIIPTTGWGFTWGNGPAWDQVIVTVPYEIYLYHGDREILTELSAPLMRYLRYLSTRRDADGLIAIGLGDWCQVDEKPTGPDTPLIVTDSIISMNIAEKAAFIYSVLDEEENCAYATALAESMRMSIRTHLIDFDNGIVHGNTQTGQAMALYYGVLTPEEEQPVFKQLLQLIDEKNGHLAVGVLGAKVLFRVLADRGYASLAYDMITRPDYPSFGNWIARGATSLWERFCPEGIVNDFSLNHHFWGDFSAWFYLYLAGIRVNPKRNDVACVDIAPCFVEQLGYVEAEYTLPGGKIAVSWIRNDGSIVLEISAADVLYGEIRLPDGYTFTDGTNKKALCSGKYVITSM